MAYKRNVEIFEEAYEKKDAKSVVSYIARDGRKRYIAGSKSPDGGGTPMPSGGMVEVKWQELKDKRDTGKLIAGSLYRITDYNCTTTQENTQSAGHQFDIVLLALSEDKLAEEGWAMMHDTPIYDVTFSDGVTKKCYLYDTSADYCNLVLVDSLLGCSEIEKQGQLVIDDVNKTISTDTYSLSDLNEENLTYNYFQNSNLSAWKVWYCLDNDKSRFAWADSSVDEGTRAFITTIEPRDGSLTTLYRYSAGDLNNLFAWNEEGSHFPSYTASQTPSAGDTVYGAHGTDSGYTVNSFTPAQEGTGLPNGRGIIYRLIDEWNNDVAYDFKNIQFVRKLTDGAYDAQGTDTWVYTFTDTEEGEITDATAKSTELFINSFIERYCWEHKLSNNVVITIGNGSGCICVEGESNNNTFYNDPSNIRLIHSQNMEIDGEIDNIYINGKKVLTEE